MNKSLWLTVVGLVALLAFGALYGRFTEAAPAARPAAPSAEPVVTAPSVAPAPSVASSRAEPQPSSGKSPEAERLEARRQLYESVDALLQASELEKARHLLDEDQARYGDDLAPPWHDLEQSYRLIADCLEHPDPRLRVRARAFAQVSEAASLRPRILEACGATP